MTDTSLLERTPGTPPGPDTPGSPQRRLQDARPSWLPLRRHEDGIYQFWDELADFGSDKTNQALTHCLRTISGWIGAQAAFWVGAVRMAGIDNEPRDPFSGWRLGRVEILKTERVNAEFLHSMQNLRTEDLGDTTRAVVSGAGQFRTYSLGTGVVDMEAFRKTAYYEHFYRRPGIADRIWVIFPINVDSESYFVFDTYDAGRSFNARELYLATEALRGIKWFHRKQLLSHGLGISDAPLAPAERRILPPLLSGATEKLIAEQLNLTQGTVHQYVTGLYRKFGVRGRAEFMALWLRGSL